MNVAIRMVHDYIGSIIMVNINEFHNHGGFGMVKLEFIDGDDLGMVYCYTK